MDELKRYMKVLGRFDYLGEELSKPENIRDQKLYRELARERSELEEAVTAINEYIPLEKRLSEAREVIEAAEDQELVDLAWAVSINMQYPLALVSPLEIYLHDLHRVIAWSVDTVSDGNTSRISSHIVDGKPLFRFLHQVVQRLPSIDLPTEIRVGGEHKNIAFGETLGGLNRRLNVPSTSRRYGCSSCVRSYNYLGVPLEDATVTDGWP